MSGMSADRVWQTGAVGPPVVRCAGITIELGLTDPERPGAYAGGRVIGSTIREPGESAVLAAALDAVEQLVLAHAVAGVDVESPAYMEGVETVQDSISNQVAG